MYNVTTFAGNGKAGYADGTGTTASFNGPNGITFDSSGNIYVTDRQNCVIRKITPDGVVSTFAGIAGKPGNTNGTRTSAQFSSIIIGIKYDGSDNFYVADYGNKTVRKISINSDAVTTFASSIPFASSITLSSSGALYVSNPGNNQITKISSGGSAQVFPGSTAVGSTNGTETSARFNYPIGITSNSANILYVADYKNHLIRQITETGMVTTIAGGTSGYANGSGTVAKFTGPTDVQLDKSGNLYVTDSGNNLIRKITSAGVVTTIAGGAGGITAGSKNGLGTTATFNMPYSLAVDDNGNVYVAEYNSNLIRKIIPNYIGVGTTDTVLTNADYGTYEAITLAGGTVQVDNNDVKIANNITLTDNTTSTFNLSNIGFTLSGVMSGSGNLTINGGKLVLAGANTCTGAININANAQLQVGVDGTPSSIASKYIINSGTLQFGASSTTLCIANISGSGRLWKSISGALTLTGTNTYTGPTTIDASSNGQTNAVLIGDISKSVGVTIASACAYDLNGMARTLIDPSGAGRIQNSGTNAPLTITAQNGSIFTGTIASSVSGLTISGTGTFTLSSTTAYPGPVTLSSGTLALTNNTSLSGTINFAKNTTLAIKTKSVTATGTTTAAAATNTPAAVIINPITFGSDATGTNPTITISVNQPTTFSGTITCNAPSGTTAVLAVKGGYPVTFTGTQTGSCKIIPSGTNTTVVTPNYTLSANNSMTYTAAGTATDSLSGYTDVTIDLSPATGTFTFGNPKSYTGILTIKNGTLQIGAGGTLITVPNTNIINNGAINFTRSSDFTYSGILSGTGTFRKSTSSKLTFTKPTTYTGATTIDAGCTIAGSIGNSVGVSIAGTYDLNGAAQKLIDPSGAGIIQSSGKNAALTITAQNGSIFAGTIASSVSGLTINGTGTFTLSSTATYPGPVIVSSGTLALTNNRALSGTINLTKNTTLALKTTSTATTETATKNATTALLITNPITLVSDKNATNSTVTINVNQPTTFSGALTCNAPSGTISTLVITGGYPVTFTGTQTGSCKIVPSGQNTSVNNNGNRDLRGTTQTFVDISGNGTVKSTGKNADIIFTSKNGSTFSGNIDNTISKLTINGSNILTLTNIDAYTGPISIDLGSTLIGNISSSANVIVNGTYDLKSSQKTLNNLSGAGLIQSSGENANLTLVSKSDSTFSGVLANTLSRLTKSGPSTLTLSGTIPYTREIIITEGTLVLANTTATSGIITLSEKATLSTNTQDTATFTNAINFGSSTVDNPTATINVNKTTTFSGPITCNASAGTIGKLIISGGHPVILTGKHIGTFAILLSGKGTSVILEGDANTNTEIVTGSTWFLLNK